MSNGQEDEPEEGRGGEGRLKPQSLHPLEPEDALRGFMEVDPEKVKQREGGESMDYICHTCGGVFGAAVVHCPQCGSHYPLADGECGNCHLEWPEDAVAAKPVEGEDE